VDFDYDPCFGFYLANTLPCNRPLYCQSPNPITTLGNYSPGTCSPVITLQRMSHNKRRLLLLTMMAVSAKRITRRLVAQGLRIRPIIARDCVQWRHGRRAANYTMSSLSLSLSLMLSWYTVTAVWLYVFESFSSLTPSHAIYKGVIIIDGDLTFIRSICIRGGN